MYQKFLSFLLVALWVCVRAAGESCGPVSVNGLSPVDAWLASGKGISYAARMQFQRVHQITELPVILPQREAVGSSELETVLKNSTGFVWKMSVGMRERQPEGRAYFRALGAEGNEHARWADEQGAAYFEVLFDGDIRCPAGMLEKPHRAIESLFEFHPVPIALIIWGTYRAPNTAELLLGALDAHLGNTLFTSKIKSLIPPLEPINGYAGTVFPTAATRIIENAH